MLDRYAKDFLVLEINHLFISSTLREEIWLLQKKEDAHFLRRIMDKCQDYGLEEIVADRNFETYSGGQKAIVACLLVMAAVEYHRIRDLCLLLVNVLESISGENRRKLSADFRHLKTSHRFRVFTGGREHPEELTG